MADELLVARILKEEHSGCAAALFAVFRGQCEGCDKAARHVDVEGVPLCCECAALLTSESLAQFDDEFGNIPENFWQQLHDPDQD